jgi:predicted amidohydrolase YtcJ
LAERPRRRLIVNARIATGNPQRPWADAMLLEGDAVLEIGASAALRKRAGDADVIDARGAEVASDGAPFRDN